MSIQHKLVCEYALGVHPVPVELYEQDYSKFTEERHDVCWTCGIEAAWAPGGKKECIHKKQCVAANSMRP